MTKNEAASELEIDLADNPTIDEIRKAYKKAALKWHPDKNDDPAATVKFQKVGEAYQRLQKALDGEDSDGDDMFEMNMEDVFNVFERLFSYRSGPPDARRGGGRCTCERCRAREELGEDDEDDWSDSEYDEDYPYDDAYYFEDEIRRQQNMEAERQRVRHLRAEKEAKDAAERERKAAKRHEREAKAREEEERKQSAMTTEAQKLRRKEEEAARQAKAKEEKVRAVQVEQERVAILSARLKSKSLEELQSEAMSLMLDCSDCETPLEIVGLILQASTVPVEKVTQDIDTEALKKAEEDRARRDGEDRERKGQEAAEWAETLRKQKDEAEKGLAEKKAAEEGKAEKAKEERLQREKAKKDADKKKKEEEKTKKVAEKKAMEDVKLLAAAKAKQRAIAEQRAEELAEEAASLVPPPGLALA
eukprot:CAMPEP_0180131722 /NCGR_PEP_ID=MMETSP0986-20121125/8577_1 /TAXON_ID=697907 /ORGANISM="non described non described, Strain CCMP2293" /LENGTH=418 /DNA_ID=CAMNT_0022071629 /DNA_START=181 /DNA_END=1433 /DNA_ORIENTATION=+